MMVIQEFICWPSALKRAGHTTVRVEDPNEPLYQFFQNVKPSLRYGGRRMGRMQLLPCLLVKSGDRWWCPVHQGEFVKRQEECSHCHDRIDFCSKEDVPVFCLSNPDDPNCQDKSDYKHYCELGVWIGLPPAMDTVHDGMRFFPGIHVHARKEPAGTKLIDTNFPVIIIRDLTGRFPKELEAGVAITSPAAFEYLCYMENHCPVANNLKIKPCLARTKVELDGTVVCPHCHKLHEDIGDDLGQLPRKEKLCGQCGRTFSTDSGRPTIANPLIALRRNFQRDIVGTKGKDLHLAVLKLESSPEGKGLYNVVNGPDQQKNLKLLLWPSTPAVFWSRPTPEVWGIHVHAYHQDYYTDNGGNKEKSMAILDDTYGEVWIDGVKLDRADLFLSMIQETKWVEEESISQDVIDAAQELEDD